MALNHPPHFSTTVSCGVARGDLTQNELAAVVRSLCLFEVHENGLRLPPLLLCHCIWWRLGGDTHHTHCHLMSIICTSNQYNSLDKIEAPGALLALPLSLSQPQSASNHHNDYFHLAGQRKQVHKDHSIFISIILNVQSKNN